MAKMGRTVIAHGQDFEVREYPIPDPVPGSLLLRQELAGICGTDLHMWQNGIPGEMVLGHENVGVIVDMGSVELNINQLMMRRNLRLEAIWGSSTEHFVRGLPILERNEFPFADMVSHTLPLERVREGFDALNGTYRLGDETAIKIVVGSAA